MRHAKSDWGAAFDSDHQRPINDRGRRAAEAMGRLITETGRPPEHVVCSTATRARMTAELASEVGGWDAELCLEEALYGASPTTIFDVLSGIDDGIAAAMLVAHEPAMSATLSLLLGDAPVAFPTAAVACIELAPDSWSSIEPACGYLRWFLPPRILGSR
jgi:phosphohistidine phosphatase